MEQVYWVIFGALAFIVAGLVLTQVRSWMQGVARKCRAQCFRSCREHGASSQGPGTEVPLAGLILWIVETSAWLPVCDGRLGIAVVRGPRVGQK